MNNGQKKKVREALQVEIKFLTARVWSSTDPVFCTKANDKLHELKAELRALGE